MVVLDTKTETLSNLRRELAANTAAGGYEVISGPDAVGIKVEEFDPVYDVAATFTRSKGRITGKEVTPQDPNSLATCNEIVATIRLSPGRTPDAVQDFLQSRMSSMAPGGVVIAVQFPVD